MSHETIRQLILRLGELMEKEERRSVRKLTEPEECRCCSLRLTVTGARCKRQEEKPGDAHDGSP